MNEKIAEMIDDIMMTTLENDGLYPDDHDRLYDKLENLINTEENIIRNVYFLINYKGVKMGIKNKKQLKENRNTTKSIFLIEQIWFDGLENHISDAVGYSPFGYLETEKEAKEFCNKGKIYKSNRCWAMYEEMPQYRYKKIKYITKDSKWA